MAEGKTKKFGNISFRGSFGVDESIINPPLGIYFRNWGASKWDNAIGVHKPLKMQCLVMKGDAINALLVLFTADLGWWINAEDESTIRRYILDYFHLDEAQLIFALSHTHAGPSICSNDKDKPGGDFIVDYLKYLKETMVTLLKNAMGKLEGGTLAWEYGKCGLATNRDLPIGNNRFLVGFNPEKKADDTLLLLHVRNDKKQNIASLVNYACHPTTLAHENRYLSPDYIGEMRDVIGQHTAAPCLFLQGASGELAPMVQYVSDTAIADAHGRSLAFSALSVLERLLPHDIDYVFEKELPSGAPLGIWKYEQQNVSTRFLFEKIEIEIPLKDLPSWDEIHSQWVACEERVLKDRLWRKLNTRQVVGEGRLAKVQVWIWVLGDGIIVAQPNETYSYFQLEIRKAFPEKKIAIVNIANGYIGYLPNAEYYNSDIYSVSTTPYAVNALEILTEGVIDAIRKLIT